MHTVILGNGILALTIAYRLAKRLAGKDRITIIGKRARPGSATLAAAAMLNSFAEIEAGSLQSELDLYRFELSRLAASMWPIFQKELVEAAGFSGPGGLDCGTYVINNAAADDLDDENFDAIVAALLQFGEPFEHVSPRDIPNYMPEQRHRATRALYIPGEGWMNPRPVLQKLEAVLANHARVTFVDDSAMTLTLQGHRIGAVRTETGQTIAGEAFILATGATVSDVLARSNLGISVQRVFYGVGVSVEIKSPHFPHRKCIRTPNRGLACGLYTVPYVEGRGATNDHVLVGASNFISPTPCSYGRVTSIESLLRGAIEQINANFYGAELIGINVGWRPTTLDSYPLLGRTSIDNLIIATGTKRDGFHLSPLVSEKIVAMLLGEPVEDKLMHFSPERPPIRSLSRQAAIDKAVRHLVSAAYQHGFAPAKSRMPAQIAQMHRDDLERLHDKVGAHEWGIPPEMLDMYRYGHAVA